MSEVAKVLEDAADLLESERVDWCQRNLVRRNDDGFLSVCAWGALGAAVVGLDADLIKDQYRPVGLVAEAAYAVRSHLRCGEWPPGLAWYNDSKGRTKQDVIDVFKATAKDLRNRAEPS